MMNMPTTAEQARQSDAAVSFGPFTLRTSQRLLERAGTPLPLGGRALDILIVLVQRAGEVVSKADLLDQVWSDVTVDEGALRFHVAALRKALGDGDAGARYVATLSGRGYCFVAPVVRAGQPVRTVLPVPAVPGPSARLPAVLARMVGRDDTVREIASRLVAERFVTIAGPGGIGKTTVAVAVSHQLQADFAGAIAFLDLGPLSDPLLVPDVIAAALGLSVQVSDPAPGVIRFLRDRRMLLVLDSCEHVIETTAELAERIHAEAPDVHILATSREPLRVEGEHVHRLPPLGSPPADADIPAQQALDFPAVQLFVERVVAGGRAFEMNDADAAVVGEICRRLDGIALAIELAARRVEACGLRGTLELLTNRFNLLREGRRTALPRHQTLGATLDWSYELLSELERATLCRLSVLAGAFRIEAAVAVAAEGELDDPRVVDALASLVEKSLVAVSGSADVIGRYRLLDTTRFYASAKLAERGETDRAKRRHAEYFLELLARDGAGEAAAGALDNVRAALEWSFSERGDAALGAMLAAAAARPFLDMSLLTECVRWTEQAIAALAPSMRGTAAEMTLQAALGQSLMFTRGNSDGARDALFRALALAEALDDPRSQLRLLGRLTLFDQRKGDYRSAAALAGQTETVAARLGDPASLATANWFVGFARYFAGDLRGAEANWETSQRQGEESRIATSSGRIERDTTARVRCGLAALHWLRGFPDLAVAAINDEIGGDVAFKDPSTLSICLIFGGFTLLRSGSWSDAAAAMARLVDHARKYSLAPYEAIGSGMQGLLAIRRGEAADGIELLHGAIETLRGERYELHNAVLMAGLAEGLAMTGQSGHALRTIDDAIAGTQANGQLFSLAEFWRIKGDILLTSPEPDPVQAEALFAAAIDLSARQSALSWQLRAATSLAQLQHSQHRAAQARQLLADVYGQFTEGFATHDLMTAQALLAELHGTES